MEFVKHFSYLFRGASYLTLGKYNESLNDFNKVIELDPKSAFGYAFRGASYMNLYKKYEALNDLNKAIEINPNSAIAYHTLASLYYGHFKRGRKGCRDAKKACELGECLVYRFLRNARKCR